MNEIRTIKANCHATLKVRLNTDGTVDEVLDVIEIDDIEDVRVIS